MEIDLFNSKILIQFDKSVKKISVGLHENLLVYTEEQKFNGYIQRRFLEFKNNFEKLIFDFHNVPDLEGSICEMQQISNFFLLTSSMDTEYIIRNSFIFETIDFLRVPNLFLYPSSLLTLSFECGTKLRIFSSL